MQNWIRIDPKVKRLHECMKYVTLPTVLQSRDTWNRMMCSRLIESILLGIPLATFYFDEDTAGVWHVIDGVKRLMAIQDYLDNTYPLECLDYLLELKDNKFEDIEGWQQRKILRTHLEIKVIDPSIHKDVKRDVFKRIRFPEYLSAREEGARIKYLGLD